MNSPAARTPPSASSWPAEKITDWSISFTIRNAPHHVTDSAIVYRATTALGLVTFPSGEIGVFDVPLAAALTLGFSSSETVSPDFGYVWEARRTDAGYNRVLCEGDLIVNEGVDV